MRFARNLGIIGALILAAPPAAAATQDQQQQDMEASMQEMQERTREATTPGEHHEALARFVGEWDVEIAMLMPGSPEQRSQGTATYEWLMEGRWLSQRIVGSIFGGEYESFSIIGFDNYAKNHVLVTVSSMDTAMNMARGLVVDPEGDVTAMYGTLDEYTTGEVHKPYKVVTRIIDDDSHVTEIWDLGIGTDGAKVLEFTYSRR